MVHRYNRVDSYIDGLVIPAVYKLNNGLASAQVKLTDKNYNVHSVYGLAAFGLCKTNILLILLQETTGPVRLYLQSNHHTSIHL